MKTLQERLAGGLREDEPRNRFGAVSDMQALLAGFRRGAMKSLEHFDGHWRASAWFELLREVAHRSGARLIVIEVPMRSSYRAEVLQTRAARRYDDWLRTELLRAGDLFLDESSPRAVTDDDFGDGLHLDAAGSRRFSAELGEELARALRALH